MDLYSIDHLTYLYPEQKEPTLRIDGLAIEEGEFILVAGESGSGKSTLVRALAGLVPRFYGGRFGGELRYRGRQLIDLPRQELAREVGIVFQDPEKQLVMTEAEAEIAFGLENLGLPPEEMAARIAEVMTFFQLASVKGREIWTLSGGQQQKVAIASVLAMQPRVLILDEPTSQLDPAAAEEILSFLKRLNEDLAMTIILVEQRLERCFHLADRVLYMEGGAVAFDGSPGEMAQWGAERSLPVAPPVARFFAGMGLSPVPITVKAGRKALRVLLPQQGAQDHLPTTSGNITEAAPISASAVSAPSADTADDSRSGKANQLKASPRQGAMVSLERIWFNYANGWEALQDVTLNASPGDFVALLGPNGAGKSTLLRLIAGLIKPGRGRRSLFTEMQGSGMNQADLTGSIMKRAKTGHPVSGGRIGYLAQNPNDYLLQDTVEAEVAFGRRNFGLPDDGTVEGLLQELHLEAYRSVHPRDLSGGERQRVAIAAVLATEPALLLLDEPTRGMDVRLKEELGALLRRRADAGACVILVTHDVEFVARYAARALRLEGGRVVRDDAILPVLRDSLFYSTQIGRLFRHVAPDLLTPEAAWAAYRDRRGLRSLAANAAPSQPSPGAAPARKAEGRESSAHVARLA
ncbi:ATP-binding cassette domain-containing protein [Heliobacterium gestii]|uniref:ATP-binding cassette domain-containing protein n=1 Tax=Heliomicrobium gestii TaxID=2699 RepID=A0A845LDW6_HELGE|nr:ABC transporter ATP-binding protein [Heliomicrobium gestii]MBM7868093.1 energy-coupling factor transport system ATP-binding protein [Heliomicrobium gestii]MZP44378.1 ATP-binding cassette domain-containing protein [Heliomicrobium gestii]